MNAPGDASGPPAPVADPDDGAAPLLVVAPAGEPEALTPGVWRIVWRLKNRSGARLSLLEAWFPHNLYFAPRRRFDAPVVDLAPGKGVEAAFEIACGEPPGTVVENAFLILQVATQGVRWRLLARLTVTVATGGAPIAAVEAVTAQRAGFSAGLSG